MASAPAGAQELIDVAALEAQVEAAAELTELPTEPDWGVPDLSDSLPAVTQDAPEVPSASTTATEAPPEPRYHAREPQYHAEYHGSEVDPAPPPATEPTPSATAGERVETHVRPEATPVSLEGADSAAVPEPASTPTIWVWVWNWTWVQGGDERYHNSYPQYPSGRVSADQELTRIMDKIGSQIPVQISVQTSRDIADEIIKEVAPEVAAMPAVPAAVPVPAADYRAPSQLRKTKLPLKSKPAPGSLRVADVHRAPLDPVSLAPAAPATTEASAGPREARRAGKAPRARRASRPSPALPLPSERLADKTTASGVSAGILLKTFVVLIASLLLAALGYGRRLRLPSTRLRGLLGTETDPPG
jgi:hypothetical protein